MLRRPSAGKREISISHNPAGDYLIVNAGAAGLLHVQVFNITDARILYKELQILRLPVARLNPGMYLLRVTDAKGYVFTLKFLIYKS